MSSDSIKLLREQIAVRTQKSSEGASILETSANDVPSVSPIVPKLGLSAVEQLRQQIALRKTLGRPQSAPQLLISPRKQPEPEKIKVNESNVDSVNSDGNEKPETIESASRSEKKSQIEWLESPEGTQRDAESANESSQQDTMEQNDTQESEQNSIENASDSEFDFSDEESVKSTPKQLNKVTHEELKNSQGLVVRNSTSQQSIQNNDQTSRVRYLEVEVKVLKEQLVEAKKKCTELQEQVDVTQEEENEDKEEELSLLHRKLEQRDRERAQYKDILRELNAKLEERSKERLELQTKVKKEQQFVAKEKELRVSLEETLKKLERKLAMERKRNEELELEVERRVDLENSLRDTIEKSRETVLEEIAKEESGLKVHNRQLEGELERMRQRLEIAINERDKTETLHFETCEELAMVRDDLSRIKKDKDRGEQERESLCKQVEDTKQKLVTETRARREAEKLSEASFEYKNKFHKEWEYRIALETKYSVLERDVIILKKKLENEAKLRRETEEANQKLELDTSKLREEFINKAETLVKEHQETERILQIQLRESARVDEVAKKNNEILQLKGQVQEMEIQFKLEMEKSSAVHARLEQMQKELDSAKRTVGEQIQEIRDIEDMSGPASLESKFLKLKRESKILQEENVKLQEVLKAETHKKEELVQTKVRLEKNLLHARQKLKKVQSQQESFESAFSSSAPTVLAYWKVLRNNNSKKNGVTQHQNHLESRKTTKSPMTGLEGVSTQDLHLYIQELLAKLEDQTIEIMQLQQENVELKRDLTSKTHEEEQLREYIKKLEGELETANNFIQFQHEEFATKAQELKDAKQKLITVMRNNQRSSLSPYKQEPSNVFVKT